MTYQDTVNWMFSQLPMYQRQGKSAYKVDLTNSISLANHLKNPHHKFKSVHVAGTNGKGSTSHMIASILQEAGYTVGLYTSPHLKDFRERIKINGQLISKQFVIGFINRNRPFLETNSLSFFEMTVGMAFDYFAKKKVDIAIIETGLGGRLDSTNIMTPEVSVITNIGKDHTPFLGETIGEIAMEKAGIIKPNIPVVIGEYQVESEPIFKSIAQKNGSEITFASNVSIDKYECDLKGSYQVFNLKTAVQTIFTLRERGFIINNSHIKRGLLHVVKNTGLMGRWQILNTEPKIICDTAHNKEGLLLVMEQLLNEKFDKLHIVFGVVTDKDLRRILPILPNNARYYFCKPNIARGMDTDQLMGICSDYGIKGNAYSSVKQAYDTAFKNSKLKDLIFIGGSTFVVAEII